MMYYLNILQGAMKTNKGQHRSGRDYSDYRARVLIYLETMNLLLVII